MDFKIRLEEELLKAAKGQNKPRLSSLRLIKNVIHNKEIDAHKELDMEEILQSLSSMIKQRRDSVEQFVKGNRTDLVEKEEAEIAVIQEFMPQQLSPEELSAAIDTAIAEANAASIKDMGKVMKLLIPIITGKADGKAAGGLVKGKLSAL